MSAISEMSAAAAKDTPAVDPSTLTQIAPAQPAPNGNPTPPAAEPAKPATPPPAPAPEKPAEVKPDALQRASDKMAKIVGDKKPAAPKVDKAKVAEAPDEEVEKHIKPNANAWRVYEAKKKAWAEKEAGFTTKTAELEKKIAELSAKPNPTAADDTKLKALEARLAERETEAKTYRQKLEERDYTQSSEYQEKYLKPWNAVHAEAYAFVKGVQVLDPETGEPSRQATEADFEKVKSTPIQQRRAVAKALFGEDIAGDVVDYVKEIDRIGKGAQDAIANHSQNYEKISAERRLAQEGESKKFQELENTERMELEQKFPDYFSVEHHKDNPELQKALAEGYAQYDQIASGFSKLSPQEQAATKVLHRAWFAAFPLMHKQVETLKGQVASLTEELARIRGTDPGTPKPSTGAVTPAESEDGIKGMAARFNQA